MLKYGSEHLKIPVLKVITRLLILIFVFVAGSLWYLGLSYVKKDFNPKAFEAFEEKRLEHRSNVEMWIEDLGLFSKKNQNQIRIKSANQEESILDSENARVVKGILRGPFLRALIHYPVLILMWFLPPDACQEGKTLNQLQEHMCAVYWKTLMEHSWPFLIPIILFLVIIGAGAGHIKTIYSGLIKAVINKPPESTCVVLRPCHAFSGFWGWLLCFRGLRVVTHDGQEEIVVFFPSKVKFPKPDDKVKLYKLKGPFGMKKFFALPYNPHIAVFR